MAADSWLVPSLKRCMVTSVCRGAAQTADDRQTGPPADRQTAARTDRRQTDDRAPPATDSDRQPEHAERASPATDSSGPDRAQTDRADSGRPERPERTATPARPEARGGSQTDRETALQTARARQTDRRQRDSEPGGPPARTERRERARDRETAEPAQGETDDARRAPARQEADEPAARATEDRDRERDRETERPPSAHMDQKVAHETFVRDWNNYQAVLQGDHLEHEVLYCSMSKELADFRKAAAEPLVFADLGCGDSDYICRSLKVLQESHTSSSFLASYVGVDLSQPALGIAKDNLSASLDSRTRMDLLQQDFLSWAEGEVLRLARPPCKEGSKDKGEGKSEGEGEGEVATFQGYDAILMSFALHHLDAEKKERLIQLAYELLHRKGGILLLVDRAVDNMKNDWLTLTIEGRQVITEHVTKFDFPESVETYQGWGAKAGFTHAECIKAAPIKAFSKVPARRAHAHAHGHRHGHEPRPRPSPRPRPRIN
eukprot:gene3919-13992_t